MTFLDEVRPFERARINSGLRDLLAMDIIDSHYDAERDCLSLSQSENYAVAQKAHDIPKSINIDHLKTAEAQRSPSAAQSRRAAR